MLITLLDSQGDKEALTWYISSSAIHVCKLLLLEWQCSWLEDKSKWNSSINLCFASANIQLNKFASLDFDESVCPETVEPQTEGPRWCLYNMHEVVLSLPRHATEVMGWYVQGFT